jgi:hypothetical protein
MAGARTLLRKGLSKLATSVIGRLGHDRYFRSLDPDLRARMLPALVQGLPHEKYFAFWENEGLHLTPVHFYQPIPDTRSLGEELWSGQSALPGVVIREEPQLELLESFVRDFRGEYEAFPKKSSGVPWEFHFDNPSFLSVDAEILYCMVRHFKPRRIIEIGSGYTTYLAASAVLLNQKEGHPCELVAIEPYPAPALKQGFPGLGRLIDQKVEDVPLELFESLGENDILFIDSSHVLAIGNDVHYEYLELLPRLSRGVIVHIHDIFLPAEYPKDWVMTHRRFWTEQYLLQAFLAFNESFEVIWGGNWMRLHRADRLQAAFSSYEPSKTLPGSFWMRKVR